MIFDCGVQEEAEEAEGIDKREAVNCCEAATCDPRVIQSLNRFPVLPTPASACNKVLALRPNWPKHTFDFMLLKLGSDNDAKCREGTPGAAQALRHRRPQPNQRKAKQLQEVKDRRAQCSRSPSACNSRASTAVCRYGVAVVAQVQGAGQGLLAERLRRRRRQREEP